MTLTIAAAENHGLIPWPFFVALPFIIIGYIGDAIRKVRNK